MANKFARAVGGNWDTDATWSTTDGGGADTTKPTSSDDVFLTATSGQVTINAAANCKTLTCTGYTNTLTHNTFALNTFGNIVFVSGMTYTQVTGAYINFSTAGTLTTGGKTMPSLIATAKITLGDNVTFSAATTLYIKLDSSGTALDMNGKTLSGGSSINRLLIYSGTVGTGKTLLINSGTFANTDFQDIIFSSASDVDLSAITGGSGNCGGNTLTGGGATLTFTTSADQHWISASGGNWSDITKWTSRVPLPQDDVYFDNAFSASQTVTANMSRLGRSISWTGATGSPTWALGNDCFIYGNLVQISGMSATGNFIISMGGRSAYTFTSSGINSAHSYTLNAPTGSMTLNDAVTCKGIRIDNGTFNSGSMTITLNQAFSAFTSNTGTRTINLGTSNIIFSSNTLQSTFWNFVGSPTLSASSSTILLTGTSTATKTFAGAGLTYGTLTYTVAGSTGELDITGSNSFAQINFSDASNARSLKFTAGTTITIRNTRGFNVQGTSGKLMTVASITASTHTLSSVQLQSCDYLSITNSIAQGGGAWYAGANSTDGTGNTGWIFTAPPPSGGGGTGVGGLQGRQNLRNLQNLI